MYGICPSDPNLFLFVILVFRTKSYTVPYRNSFVIKICGVGTSFFKSILLAKKLSDPYRKLFLRAQ